MIDVGAGQRETDAVPAAEHHRQRQELDHVRRGLVRLETQRVSTTEGRLDASHRIFDEARRVNRPQLAFAHEPRVTARVDVLEILSLIHI